MRALTWFPLVCVVLCAGCGAATSAWDPLATTPGPVALPDGMDDRDPHAFYGYGQRILTDNPRRAAAAFYWASRLDPSWASPMFARRMALFLAEPAVFDRYLQGDRRTLATPGVQRLDSLYLRALALNPFPDRAEDARAVRALMMFRVKQYLRRSGQLGAVNESALAFQIDEYLVRSDPETRAWLAYSERRYRDAELDYRKALQRDGKSPWLRADFARCLFRLGLHEEAAAELERAVALLSERDEDELVRVYESKALYGHSIGMLREAVGNRTAARESYARALQEDLTYVPAHMRLAELALAAGDTVTATSEMALAAEIQPDDPAVRYRNGLLLGALQRWDAAETELRAALEIEPLFAAPHRALAVILEHQGRSDEAAAEHVTFLEKSYPDAPGVAESRAWLEGTRAGTR